MDSFAITYKLGSKLQAQDPNDKQVTADLHVNYWKLPRCRWGSSYTRFVDFGVMIHEYANYLDSIQVFLPFKIKDEQIKDLGGRIGNSTELLCSLFNEEFVCTNNQNAKSYYSVNTPPGSAHDAFFIYKLDKENFEVKDAGNGSLVNIKILTVPSNVKGLQQVKDESKIPAANLYLRFRIEKLEKNSFCNITSIQNDVLQKAFSKIEYLDFKVNRKRDIEGKVQEMINREYVYLKYKKIHFFFGSSFKDGEIEGSLPMKDTRIIDVNRWGKYFEGVSFWGNSVMTTHHWETKADENDLKERFDLFFKTKYSSDSFLKILWYLAIVVALGTMGSLIANMILPSEESAIELKVLDNNTKLYDGRGLSVGNIVELLLLSYGSHSLGKFGAENKEYCCGTINEELFRKWEYMKETPMAVLCKDVLSAKNVVEELEKRGFVVIKVGSSVNKEPNTIVFIHARVDK